MPFSGFSGLGEFRVLPPVEDFIMPRTKRWPGATQEDPPSKKEEEPPLGDRAFPVKGLELIIKTILCCVVPSAFRPGFLMPLPISP